MSFTINIYYTGSNGLARNFAEEMVDSGIVQEIFHFAHQVVQEYKQAKIH